MLHGPGPAQDPRLKRQVAIKLLTADLTRDETAKQRFQQEAQAASALDHLNICTIHELNETPDGQLYLVMAYYAGETLKQRIERGPLALDEGHRHRPGKLLRVPMIITETIVLLSVSTAMAVERGTEPRLPTSTSVRAVQSAPAPDVDDSVAITVFSNISGAAPDDWIGTGIVETLAADIEGAGGVPVVARQAVSGAIARLSAEGRSAEATEETAVAAGRLLGARWVISGGYQRLGDRMRITARVVEVETATVVHTAIVDGTVTDLFALQDQLAAELRQGLPAGGRTVAPSGAARAPRGEPSVVEPPASVSTGAPTAAEAPRGGVLATAPTRLIDGPAPPLAPETIARDAAGRATVRAVRLTEPMRLDGTLDEGVYETVLPVGGFIQQVPDEGAAPTEETEAWVFFDAQHVYVSARPLGLRARAADRQ